MEPNSGGGSAAGPVHMPPSREKMRCGYRGCHYNGQRRSFKRHNAVKHAGQAVVFQNNSFGQGGRWREWVLPTSVDAVQANVDADADNQISGARPALTSESEGEI